MKGGLCVIYTSLLTISVLSSCAFFLLVVTEALQVEGEVNRVDLSGLHNVSQKVTVGSENELPVQKSVDEEAGEKKTVEKPMVEQEMTFPDTLSLNSVTTEGLPDAGQPPILVSLADTAKLELKSPGELLFVNDSEQHNDTKTFAIADSSDSLKPDEEKDKKSDHVKEAGVPEPHLVVQAKPMHELRQTKEAFQTTPTPLDVDPTVESQTEEKIETDKPIIPVKPDTPQEDIPSFSEWAQKQLAEAEKKDTVLNHSSQPSHSNTNFSSKNNKIRSKNYASPACGAKIVAANPESGSASSILSPNRDEYMLNTCNSRIWFVVELCEPVQAQKIEIANFELFSSTPKDIAVYFSDRFPTREWASVGQFAAQDMRDIQSFDLFPHLFGKFIKVEMLSHHGSEHYCPVSMFKVYGTSEFEVLEKESSQHPTPTEEDDDDEIIDIPSVPAAETEPTKNLFGSARDAVMSIMKKAAQALVKSEVPKNVSSEYNDTSADNMYKQCCSPSHIIVCDNCSETLYNEVYELISCSADRLTNLIRLVFLRDTLKCTGVCRQFGLDFKSTKTIEFGHERAAYLNAIFPPKYLAALCNMLAINEKKVVLNTSFETELNVTSNLTVEDSNLTTGSDTKKEQEVIAVPIKNNVSIDKKADEMPKLEDSSIRPETNIDKVSKITMEIPVEEKETKGPPKVDIKSEDLKTPMEEKPKETPNDSVKPVNNDDKATDTKIEQENKDTKIDNKNGKTDSTTEKPKEIGNNGSLLEDVGDQIIIDTDSFMSDLDQMAVDPTPSGTTMQNPNQAQTIQKESVFLRLSNRVKALERNMSLSGQYLEELSRRYKKQVEEMQKSFEKTILQMTDERRKSNEREQKYLEQITNMQEQLAQVASAMLLLMEERDSWFGNITFFKFIIYQVIIIASVIYYISTKRRPNPIIIPVTKKVRKKQDRFRRKSVEGVSGHETPSAKKRRPSEEALQIARQSAGESRDDDDGEWIVARKNRRRKISMIRKPLDYDAKTGLLRQDSIGQLQENPIPLDDDEFLAPVSEPKEFNEDVVSTPPKKELPKSNGSIFNNFKTKTMKTRRLSSPAFLRTLSRQSTRSTPSPVVKQLEPIFNGKGGKAASESPTGSLWSESADLSQNKDETVNGAGKKKKSFRNIFKKVF